jgi:predicted NBD/HSP70 family sugar kinase
LNEKIDKNKPDSRCARSIPIILIDNQSLSFDINQFSSSNPAQSSLFGGSVKAGPILLDTVRKSFEQHLIPPLKNKIQIIESTLPIGDAAIIGAAALVTQ